MFFYIDEIFQMANSGIHDRSSSCFKPINKILLKDSSFSMKNKYPASVREISAMLVHARKESLQESEPMLPQSPHQNVNVLQESKVNRPSNLNKNNSSHQCGSFFAKCNCKNEDKQTVFNTYSYPARSYSIPVPQDFHGEKRLSSPEIDLSDINAKQPNVCLKPKSPAGTPTPSTVIKANVFLNHPEITFPIPVEVSKEDYQNNSFPSNLYPEIKHKLDYHKATALAYESQKDSSPKTREDEAEKFFKEFGLFGPMGNGIGANFKRYSRDSIEENTLNQIRKNSKTIDFKSNRKLSNVNSEDYEHLKCNLEGREAIEVTKTGSFNFNDTAKAVTSD